MSQEQPPGSLSEEPLLSVRPPEPDIGKGEEGDDQANSGDNQKNSAPGASHSHSKEDQRDPFDNW